jgi:hypothetical protein
MIQRVALLAGGLAAAAVLAVALGLTNFVFAGPNATSQTPDSQPTAQAANTSIAVAGDSTTSEAGAGPGQGAQAQTQPKKVVDKVYIAPTPTPKVFHATKPAPNAPPAQTGRAPKAPPATAAPSWQGGQQGQESDRNGGHHQRGDN